MMQSATSHKDQIRELYLYVEELNKALDSRTTDFLEAQQPARAILNAQAVVTMEYVLDLLLKALQCVTLDLDIPSIRNRDTMPEILT